NFQKRFLVTHFFNPPRYMHLLEIVSSKNTSPDIIQKIVDFGENVLGKGVVYAKDTPNFIANRIGVFSMMLALKLTQDLHLTVEEVDKLTGPVIGHPKSATYRTADLVGLDTLVHVARTAYEKATSDEARHLFEIPHILQKLLKNNRLGEKTKKGFYQKIGKEILSLNFDSLEYTPQKKVRLDGLRLAKKQWATAGKIKTLAFIDDIAGKFVWELLSGTMLYAANRIPEIADNPVYVDNAMKWGFGWEMGPFETWEALGIEQSLERMSEEGKKIPAWVEKLYNQGHRSFYIRDKKHLQYYDLFSAKFKTFSENPKVIHLNILKNSGHEIEKNWNASLIDLGDGIALAEFHSIIQPTLNPIDGAILDIVSHSIDRLPGMGYKALVIGHQGQHFTAGANLALILKYAAEKEWHILERLSKTLQDINQKIRFAGLPVIAAPFNMCLGGGFELIAACDYRVASAELYCGLVEAGIGVIPGGGGNLRLLLNNISAMSGGRPGPFPIVQKTFETIAFARVSTSAKEAVYLSYLRKNDKIVVNPDHLISEAKKAALQLVENYDPPGEENEIFLPGEGGRLAIESIIESYVKAGSISSHDALIGKKLAFVLTGGEKASPHHPVDEQYLLDIEREAFVSLCAEPKTRQRMAHMLKTGKPLRN
ncbi:MAG: 3-hydroxyacyl-CoA dehydrogenase, partial [Calditrichaeota bacterium]|nr:3-hydroxyacyl-CoA dehydrogenase [Calditrichota bacterium]